MSSLAVTDRRDGLLAGLLAAEPGQVVLRWDADVAVLLASTPPRQLLLLTAPPDMPEDRLAYAFSVHVKTVTRASPPTHVVVMGGGPEVAAALKKTAPLVQPVPMGFHHVDAAFRYAHVTGQRLPILERVVERLDPTAPVDRAGLGDALARGQALLSQERAIAARLQGRMQVTAVIMAVCAALTGLSYLWGTGAHDAALWRMGANRGAALRQGEVWRLFASAFLHAEWRHLLMNMFALWSLGPLLEAILGPRRYVLLYGAAALGGSLASGLFGADHWSVGASGAIWGLLGAAFGLALRPNGVLPPRMAQQMKGRAGMALLINLGISMVPGIDFRAHLGGGVVGFALMVTVLSAGLTPLEQRATPADAERRRGPLLSIAAALMAAAMALSIVVALVAGRPWEVGAAPALRRTAIADTGLTLDVPLAITEEKSAEAGEPSRTRIFASGELNETPVVFEIIVAPLDEEIAAGPALDAFLESAREDLDQHGPPKAVRAGPAKRLVLGGRPAVLVEHELNGFHIATYLEVVGAHQVLVRGYAHKERPPAWQGIEAKVAASLAVK